MGLILVFGTCPVSVPEFCQVHCTVSASCIFCVLNHKYIHIFKQSHLTGQWLHFAFLPYRCRRGLVTNIWSKRKKHRASCWLAIWGNCSSVPKGTSLRHFCLPSQWRPYHCSSGNSWYLDSAHVGICRAVLRGKWPHVHRQARWGNVCVFRALGGKEEMTKKE